MGKWGGRRVFCQAEPNFPLPYSTVPVPQLSDARPAGWVICYSTVYARVQCREPKTGQQKVQLSRKTKYFAHLGINLSMGSRLCSLQVLILVANTQEVIVIHFLLCLISIIWSPFSKLLESLQSTRTVFVAKSSTFSLWMVTHPSSNTVPSCLCNFRVQGNIYCTHCI